MGQPDTAHILVVDDDPTVADVVINYLRHASMTADHAADGMAAVAMFTDALATGSPYDLVVLDLMLPKIDGLEVCRMIREAPTQALGSATRLPTPVIMLTARGEEEDRVLGLEVGADDYLTKPFSPRELLLRIQSILRRTQVSVVAQSGPDTPTVDLLSDGDITIDLKGHWVRIGDTELSLTTREFDLLAFLVAHPDQAFSREELMTHVWQWEYGDRSTVTVHVRRLREKVEADATRPVRLVTVWGVGYRWDSEAAINKRQSA